MAEKIYAQVVVKLKDGAGNRWEHDRILGGYYFDKKGEQPSPERRRAIWGRTRAIGRELGADAEAYFRQLSTGAEWKVAEPGSC